MRLCCQLTLLIGLVTLPTFGQGLDLPEPITAPELTTSWASDVVGQLDAEIDELKRQLPSATPQQRLLIEVAIAHRAIAGSLLASGERAGIDGSHAIVSGGQLARARDQIDGALDALRSGDQLNPQNDSNQAHINAALRRFVDRHSDPTGLVVSLEPEELDEWLVTSLSPLAEVVSHFEGQPLESHWISQDEIDGVIGAEFGEGADQDLFEESIRQAQLMDETRAAMTLTADRLRQAQKVPALRIKARALQTELYEAIQFGQQLQASDWLPKQQETLYRDRWETSLVWFSEAEKRKESRRVFDELEAIGLVLKQMTTMRNHERLRVQPSDMVDILRSLEREWSAHNDIDLYLRQLDFTLDVLNIMATYRELLPLNVRALPPGSLRGDLARTERAIDQKYKRLEREVITKLPSLLERQADRSNPAVTTLVETLRDALEDIQRLRSLDKWYGQMVQFEPSAHTQLASTMRLLALALLDARAREQAVKSMAQLEYQIDRFGALPGEAELVKGDLVLSRLSGGQEQALAKTIEVKRRQWVRSWAEQGAGGSAAFAMEQLWQLLSLMSAMVLVEPTQESGELGQQLASWSGWPIDQKEVDVHFRDLSSRLTLAVAAANDGRFDEVEKQNLRITDELTVAELAARVQLRLRSRMAESSQRATGVLNRLVFPPTPDSWLHHRRTDLVELARYLPEISRLEIMGEAEQAAEIQAYVRQLARDVLQDRQVSQLRNTQSANGGSSPTQGTARPAGMGGN